MQHLSLSFAHPQTDTRIQRMVQKIRDQIDHNINDRHPHHIRLDHRLIAHGERVNRQLADTIPQKNVRNDRRTAQQASDRQREQRNDRQKR